MVDRLALWHIRGKVDGLKFWNVRGFWWMDRRFVIQGAVVDGLTLCDRRGCGG